ncbi:hypothetical protein [uncultured Desulfobacter sp.]|uniref:ECs_2282 family putative zinc-binding protein n=1 Tax=uncultured Desulfobacter sp. TaxID=240139 RepID=UPI002AA6B70D|nr:hypothetical protein [uncultured Desulfobacter sp.]
MSENAVEITCANCGGKDFEYPSDPQPDDVVTCTGCGASATYKEIIDAAEAQIVDQLKKDIGDIFS